MNNILIFNKHTELDPLFIWQITKVLSKVDDYTLCRSWKDGPHIKVIFNEKVSFTQLQEVRDEIEKSIYEMGSNIIEHTEVKLQNDCVKNSRFELASDSLVKNDLFLTKVLKEMRSSVQSTLTDVYFCLKLNDVNNEIAIPVLIYYISKVVEKSDQSFFSTNMQQELNENKQAVERENESYLIYFNQFENEQQALLKMWYNKWCEIFDSIEYHIHKEFERVESTWELEGKVERCYQLLSTDNWSERKEITSLTTNTITNLLFDSLPFLYVHPVENEKYMYLANIYSKKTASINFNSD